jgi:RNA polymerase sigma-70 factor, ECF subfamily
LTSSLFNTLKTQHRLNNYSEEQLVGLLKKGDHTALAEVIKRHESMVAKVIKGMLGDVPEAEDVGQETFIRFWKRVDLYKHEAKLSTFLLKIAMNLSINELHKRKKRFLFFNSWETEQKDGLAIYKPMHDDIFSNNQLIEMALSRLDPLHRSVVVLRLVEGFSTKETAEALELPIGTVLSRLSRSLEKLRLIIGQTENK